MNPSSGIELDNLSESGQPPKSRLNDAKAVDDMVRQLIRADDRRSKVRSKLKGLVDGNPPYSPTELKRLGQSYRTNCNFREAEAFMNLGLSAFYDVFSEVPRMSPSVTVRLSLRSLINCKSQTGILITWFNPASTKWYYMGPAR